MTDRDKLVQMAGLQFFSKRAIGCKTDQSVPLCFQEVYQVTPEVEKMPVRVGHQSDAPGSFPHRSSFGDEGRTLGFVT